MQKGCLKEPREAMAGSCVGRLATCASHMAKLLRFAVWEMPPAAGSDAFAAFAQRATECVVAAVRSLRLLPLLDAAADAICQCQQPDATWGMEMAAAAARECETLAADAAVTCSWRVKQLPEGTNATQQLPCDAAALLEALWELHTASCRRVQRQPALRLSPAVCLTLYEAWQPIAAAGDPLHSR